MEKIFENLEFYNVNDVRFFHVMGRNVLNPGKNGKPVALFCSGSQIEFKIKAQEIWVQVESDYDTHEVWLCAWVNGRHISRFMAEKGKTWICLARNLNPEKENLVSLMRDTQAMSADGNQILLVHHVAVSKGTVFLPVPERKLKLEFIGDSITSGEGLCGNTDEWDWISTWISVMDNYAVKAATELNADFNIMSQCGWGVITGWDNNVKCSIPQYYEKVSGLNWGQSQKALVAGDDFDFSSFQPDYIFVNLGTNDSGAFNQPLWKDPETGIEYKMRKDEKGNPLEEDALKLSKGISDFLKLIRKHNPKARICWIWGMISLPEISPYIQKGVDMFVSETGDKNTDTMILDGMECEKYLEDKGSRGHPGSLTHLLASRKIKKYIEEHSSF